MYSASQNRSRAKHKGRTIWEGMPSVWVTPATLLHCHRRCRLSMGNEAERLIFSCRIYCPCCVRICLQSVILGFRYRVTMESNPLQFQRHVSQKQYKIKIKYYWLRRSSNAQIISLSESHHYEISPESTPDFRLLATYRSLPQDQDKGSISHSARSHLCPYKPLQVGSLMSFLHALTRAALPRVLNHYAFSYKP